MELLCGHDSILLMTTLEVTSEIYSSKFLLGREAKKEHRSSLVRHQRSHQSYLTVLRGGTKNLKKGHQRVHRRLSAARLFLGCQAVEFTGTLQWVEKICFWAILIVCQ
jgi:hypothetical protein